MLQLNVDHTAVNDTVLLAVSQLVRNDSVNKVLLTFFYVTDFFIKRVFKVFVLATNVFTSMGR